MPFTAMNMSSRKSTSYQLADKSKAYKVEGDKDTDTIIYYFENARIVVPNTGV